MNRVLPRRESGVAEPARLDAMDWIECALRVLAERGVEGIRVEVLAKLLGVTKGSFYWHFADRAALLQAMLQEWRRRATLAIIQRYESTADDAGTRLHRLLRLQFDTRNAEIGAEIELSVRLWGRHDASAAQVLQEIDELRLRYIAQLLQEAGVDPLEVHARAVLAYCYMRVSRSLLDPRRDRNIVQMCEAILSTPR